MKKPLIISPEAMKAIASAPLPNFHAMWKQYARSQFRRDHLAAWAGDDPDKQRVVQYLLSEQP